MASGGVILMMEGAPHLRQMPDGTPCWCVSSVAMHEDWVHSPTCLTYRQMFDALRAEVADQPPPVHNDSPAIWDLVVADMVERNEVGTQRYGTPLQAFNGRKPLVDAYQEGLDLVVYLRARIREDEVRAVAIAGLLDLARSVEIDAGWDTSGYSLALEVIKVLG